MSTVTAFRAVPAPDQDLAIVETKQAAFIEETTLTFTIANTGGVGVLMAASLMGRTIDGGFVVTVAFVLGLIVTILGTPWVLPKLKGASQILEFLRGVGNTIMIGVLNCGLLAVALWGSKTALESALL